MKTGFLLLACWSVLVGWASGEDEREDALTVRVVASSSDSRTIEVIAKAASEKMVVRAYHWKGQTWRNTPKPIVKKLKPNEIVKFEYKGKPEYEVKALVGGRLVDIESASKKSGL